MTEIKQEFKEERRSSHWFAIAIELYWSTELNHIKKERSLSLNLT